MRMHNLATQEYLLFILLYMLISISLTTAQECYNTGNFTTNSPYETNRNSIFSSLAIKNNEKKNGCLYNATIGQESNKVYARAVCRGDSSQESCANCVSSATHDLIAKCRNQKEALSWGSQDDPCFVLYGNYSFFGRLEFQPTSIFYNIGNITLTHFDQIWESLIDRMVLNASTVKFVTEKVNVTNLVDIYALMQCTPELSQSDCEFCLHQSVVDYQNCCHGKQGGVVLKPTCVFRWELYPFSTAPPPLIAPVVSPALAPGVSDKFN